MLSNSLQTCAAKELPKASPPHDPHGLFGLSNLSLKFESPKLDESLPSMTLHVVILTMVPF